VHKEPVLGLNWRPQTNVGNFAYKNVLFLCCRKFHGVLLLLWLKMLFLSSQGASTVPSAVITCQFCKWSNHVTSFHFMSFHVILWHWVPFYFTSRVLSFVFHGIIEAYSLSTGQSRRRSILAGGGGIFHWSYHLVTWSKPLWQVRVCINGINRLELVNIYI
jgi:hypothetical protein